MKLFLTIILSIFALIGFSQSITGQVIGEDGIPLPGAIVRVDNTNLAAVTDVNGYYRITNIPANQQTLLVEYIGYKTISQTINTDEDQIINFELTPGLDIDEITIVGRSLQGTSRALNQQKNNDNITNIVAADQVGKFPDANIGDAMKRISGITMQNDQGEARNIIIRGIAPQYNSVTLNGDRIPSAEGDNRNVQMDLIPSDMIAVIEVNKAVLPEMDADAIGGSVNLVTRTATDRRRLSATFAPGYSPIRENMNWLGSVIASDRFADGKFGVVLSGTYDRKDYGSDNFEAEYDQDKDNNNAAFMNDFQIRKYDVTRKRMSGSVGLDYKINANNTIEFKTLISDRKDWENRFRLRYKDISPDGSESEIRRETKGGINNDDVKNKRLEQQQIQDYKLKGEHFFGKKNIELDWSGSFSKASEERPNERYIVYRKKDQAVNVTGLDTDKPFVSSTDELSAGDFKFKEFSEQNKDTQEENYKGKFKLKIPLQEGINKSNLKFGYTYKNKNKDRGNIYTEYSEDDIKDEFKTLEKINTSNETFSTDDLDKYSPGLFATKESLGNINTKNYDGELIGAEYIPKNYTAEEMVNAGFVQLKKNMGNQFSFVVGARFEATNVDYSGNTFSEDNDATDFEKKVGSSNYSNFLPSLHLNYKPEKNTVVRFAYTSTLARPSYYDLVPYYSILDDNEEVEQGNPNLEAAKAINLDFMAEKYFTTVGLISGGVFYKNIDDFFYNFTENNYSNTKYNINNAKYTQPRNGKTANVYGLEVAAQRQLDFIKGLENFNVYANYTFTGSEAEIQSRDGKSDLPGTSPHMVNGSLSFENKVFNSRLSINHASGYIDEYGSSEFYDVYYDDQTFVDFNANYFFGENWTVFGEAKNLTNQPLRYYQGEENRTFQIEYYQPTYNFGVKYNF